MRDVTPAVTPRDRYGYDALGRVTQEVQPFGSTSYQYDLAGRRTRQTWGDGFVVEQDHDVTGKVTAIRENGAMSGVGVLAVFGYDDLGRRTSLTRGNGTSTAYGYDPVGRLSSLSHDLGGTADDVTFGYSYNPAGQIATRTSSNDAYAFSGAFNRDTATSVNGLNQATSVGGASVSHDARGNVTGIGGTSYSYTSENLLSAASNGTTLYYDGLGRLVEYDTDVSTRFVYDGAEIAAAVDNPAGVVTRRYVRGPGADEVLVEYAGAGNRV